MSWKERIQIPFKITTGDDKEYFPLLSQDNSGSLDMNSGSFEFSGVDGSLVKRKSTNGETYPLNFSFTGDDHLDVSEAFRVSARNKKPWIFIHPKYGNKTVQPITIKWNDSRLNETSFQVTVKETIIRNYPNALRSKEDSIQTLVDNADLSALNAYGLAVTEVSTEDKLVISDSIDQTYEQYKQFSTTTEDATTLENAYNNAKNAIDNLNENMSVIQEFVSIPKNNISSITLRIAQLRRGYDEAKKDLSTFSLKEYFQCIAASIVSAVCGASINPNEDDYSRRKDVDSVTNQINDLFGDYIITLGEIKDDNLSLTDAFNPDPDTVGSLEQAVNESVANLNEVIFGALIENVYQTPVDTNIIILTHLLLGRVSDENITELIINNDFSRDELLQVKKGTQVTYFS